MQVHSQEWEGRFGTAGRVIVSEGTRADRAGVYVCWRMRTLQLRTADKRIRFLARAQSTEWGVAWRIIKACLTTGQMMTLRRKGFAPVSA